MSFNAYKNISDVIQAFPVHYQEIDFIQELPFVIDNSFRQRLELILREGVVFNSEYAICENIISPILIEVWQSYKEQLLVWSHQPLNYDEQLSGIPDYMVAKRSAKGKIVFEEPYLIVVEAKKDNFEEGWGQCLAELIAAQKLNNQPEQLLYGIVSFHILFIIFIDESIRSLTGLRSLIFSAEQLTDPLIIFERGLLTLFSSLIKFFNLRLFTTSL